MQEEQKRAALFVATLASFLTPFMGSSVVVAIPSMARDLEMDVVLQSWIPTSYLLAAAVLLVPFGRIGDLYGRKAVFLAGMSVYTLGSLGLAITPWAGSVIPLRVLQGVGGSMLFGTGIAIITSVFPHGERGRVLGINTAAVYLGLSLGPTAGGLLTQYLGWRSIFALNVPIGLFIIYLVVTRLRLEWAEARGERFDWPGALLFSGFLVALMLGFTWLPDRRGALLLLAGALLFLVFVLVQLRRVHPVLDVAMFLANRVYAYSNLAALIAYASTAAVGFLTSYYLQYVRGMTARDAGLVLVVQPLVMAALSPLAGRLSDRVEPRLLASSGMACVATGLFAFGFLSLSTPLWGVVACLFLVGVGFGLFSSPNTNAVMSAVERRSFGVASATLATMRATGQVLSLGLATMIFSITLGRVVVGPENVERLLWGIQAAFHLFAGLCVAGVLASLARGRIHSARRAADLAVRPASSATDTPPTAPPSASSTPPRSPSGDAKR